MATNPIFETCHITSSHQPLWRCMKCQGVMKFSRIHSLGRIIISVSFPVEILQLDRMTLLSLEPWHNVRDYIKRINGVRSFLASQPHNQKMKSSSCRYSTIKQGEIHYPRNRAANFPTSSVLNRPEQSLLTPVHLTHLTRNDLDQGHQVNAVSS